MTFAAFGGRADFFSRYPVGRPAVRTMDNMKIGLIHLLPHAISTSHLKNASSAQ
jgi:hypothetical protein